MVVDTGPKETTNKDAPRSERTSAFKKDLPEPTLLEMSGNPTNQELVFKWRAIRGWVVWSQNFADVG